jgi:hypothetical protein
MTIKPFHVKARVDLDDKNLDSGAEKVDKFTWPGFELSQ